MITSLCFETIDNDLHSNRNRVFGKATPEDCVRGASFDFPCFDCAVRAFYINRDPAVGIYQFNFLDRSLQLYGLGRVILCRERMVGSCWHGRQEQHETANSTNHHER